MKFQKILMIGFSKADLGDKDWKRLNKLSKSVFLIPKEDPKIPSHLSNTDCLLVKLGAAVDQSIIDKTPNLKYIGMFGTGYGRIDTAYAKRKRIAVCNIAGYSTEGVAELAFGILIEYLRELERAKSQARKGEYSEATFTGTEIKRKKFGVIGLGRIGGRIAEIALKGFNAQVSYWSRKRKKRVEEMGIKYKELNSVLKESDFLSINLSYTPETESFLNRDRIKLIKKGAVIINLAPMELVDIDSLEKRLQSSDITFILDHSDELSKEQAKQLSRYKNCIMYPPIGYITKEATQAKRGMFIDNLENFLKGSPTNKVNQSSPTGGAGNPRDN